MTTLKEFIKLFGVLAIGLLLLGSWFLHSRNQAHFDLLAERQQAKVDMISRTISRDLFSHASDARFLARLTSRYLVHDHKAVLRDLEDFFVDFGRSRDFYFSIRYLDAAGMELVRVDRSYAGLIVTPRGMLQKKGQRYYFKQIMNAGKNEVYISRFDLNIEHGKLEKPYRPTLRIGCPVFDGAGKRLGAVVINFEGRLLLNEIRLHAGKNEGRVLFCNSEGFWILGPTEETEWANLIESREKASMPLRFPEAWSVVSTNHKAQFVTPKGLFTFDTIKVSPGELLPDSASPAGPHLKGWKILTWVPAKQLNMSWSAMYVTLGCLLFGLLGMGCWQVADNRTHRAEVVSRMRENEERTMAISQSSQDAIAMIDSKGRIVNWNPAAERLLGYSRSEALGNKLHNLLTPEQFRESAEFGMRGFMSSGKGDILNKVVEVTVLHKDGRSIPMELAASSFKFKGEWYAVGFMRDISRRRKRELELRRSEETSRALINAPTESAMLIELSGSIRAINKVGAERLGGSVEELTGQNAFERISPNMAEQSRDIINRIQDTGEPYTFEDKHGDRWMLVNIYPVKAPDGAVEQLAIFIRDITEQRLAEAALVQSEQRFRDVSEAVGEIIWETDTEGILTFVTSDVQAVGYKAESLLGKSLSVLLPEEEVDDFIHWRNGVYGRMEPFSNVEFRSRTADGRVVWLEISGTPYFDRDEIFRGYRGAAMDITGRKASEIAIKANERKLRALAESAYDAIIMIDAKGLVSFWNGSAETLFGYSEEEALGQDVHALVVPPENRGAIDDGMRRFAKDGTGPAVGAVTEMVAIHKDGTRFEVERSIAGFQLAGEWYAVATVRDITERKATEAKLRELATTDSLTGLYNRRRFMELSEREFARSARYSRPLAMFMLDIDLFKDVNDEHGHDVGDLVLRSLSEIAIIALRNADILGRLGGEEFGVLLPETDADAALDVAERLRLSIERAEINAGDTTLHITVSIGVSVLVKKTHSIGELIKRADVALYEAKQTGRNRVVMG